MQVKFRDHLTAICVLLVITWLFSCHITLKFLRAILLLWFYIRLWQHDMGWLSSYMFAILNNHIFLLHGRLSHSKVSLVPSLVIHLSIDLLLYLLDLYHHLCVIVAWRVVWASYGLWSCITVCLLLFSLCNSLSLHFDENVVVNRGLLICVDHTWPFLDVGTLEADALLVRALGCCLFTELFVLSVIFWGLFRCLVVCLLLIKSHLHIAFLFLYSHEVKSCCIILWRKRWWFVRIWRAEEAWLFLGVFTICHIDT